MKINILNLYCLAPGPGPTPGPGPDYLGHYPQNSQFILSRTGPPWILYVDKIQFFKVSEF